MDPVAIHCVAPSRVAVGEPFSLKIKILGTIRQIESSGDFSDRKPDLHGPFNLNVSRRIQYIDNCLPEWQGAIAVDTGTAMSGPKKLIFDGNQQGVFPNDTRPIKVFEGFTIQAPGFYFIRLIDEKSGVEGISNPIHATQEKPDNRIFWGDPHWQTFFSDGIRCPEELYAFARDEGFLDFGAISDHMEAVTDRQWEYFQAVTNDFNEPGRFVTLIGQEWTNHNPAVGAPGHRNIYYRGNGGPVLRSTDSDCDTLEKLWRKLDSFSNNDVIAIPHHSANVVMGIDWEQGWNPAYEKAVEIYSVWGSSEKPADSGNLRPIRASKGEQAGRHIIDALTRGYRFGFVAGGDIHDGRPGDDLHIFQPNVAGYAGTLYPQGFTAVLAPALSREAVFDAIAARRTYATTKRRIYLDVDITAGDSGRSKRLRVTAASEDALSEIALVRNGDDTDHRQSDDDPRVITTEFTIGDPAPDAFYYVRVVTESGDMAWSSPQWGDDL